MIETRSVRLPSVHARYDGFVLAIEELALAEGHVLGVFGHSGSGKTTYLRGLASALRQNGVNVAHLTQDDQSFGHLTVQQNMELFGLAAGGVPSEATDRMARRLGLGEKLASRCDNLSGGQRRRVSIAGVLAGANSVVMLDEPFVGIGWFFEEEMRRLLLEYRTEGKAMIVVSHDYDLLWSLSDQVLVIFEGRQVGMLDTTGDADMSSEAAHVIGMTNVVDVVALRNCLRSEMLGLPTAGIIGFWPQWARIDVIDSGSEHVGRITAVAPEIRHSRRFSIRGERLLEVWIGASDDRGDWLRFVVREPGNVELPNAASITIFVDKFTILQAK